MKRVTYQCLYKRVSFLSNGFDNRYLREYRVLLGTFLLILTGVCQAQKIEDAEDRLCYAAIPINQETNMIPDSCKEDTTVYLVVEEMPEFPGGSDSLMRYIDWNLKYPTEYGDADFQGRVIVSFIVEKDGSTGKAEVIRGIDILLDKEALRVVREMPKWKPGRQNGMEVRVKYTLPVRFKL